MKNRNIPDIDIHMVFGEVEKLLSFVLMQLLKGDEIQLVLDLAFDQLTTKYYRDELLKVHCHCFCV